MMEWSPQQAMKAYINTLHLSKVMNKQGCNMGWASKAPNIVEPECMELISALAAGNKAKVMVEITSGGLTPFTVALAVAAKQTGGRVVPHKDSADDDDCNNSTKRVASGAAGKNERRRLRDVVASEGVLTSVDFLVVDSKAAGEMKVEVNSKGCVVVATNLPQPQRLHERSSRGCSLKLG
ncbi:unnamed protein product [Cuscuta epithymum]|uniref:Uncharacterized protein n=1 Tax=Cuscuta epithymum TaxID=186058 RepID=A0AAV0CEZ5_9ASTE|nr:unnamed protein product [Cuscuta epithymum]